MRSCLQYVEFLKWGDFLRHINKNLRIIFLKPPKLRRPMPMRASARDILMHLRFAASSKRPRDIYEIIEKMDILCISQSKFLFFTLGISHFFIFVKQHHLKSSIHSEIKEEGYTIPTFVPGIYIFRN